jgi:hypothetical protein
MSRRMSLHTRPRDLYSYEADTLEYGDPKDPACQGDTDLVLQYRSSHRDGTISHGNSKDLAYQRDTA